LVSDGAGNVLGWPVTAGHVGDAPQAAGLLAPWLAPAQEVRGDAAYDSDALRALSAAAGAIAVIKPNPRRKAPRISTRWRTRSAIILSRRSVNSSSFDASPRVTINWTERSIRLSVCALSHVTLIENSS